MGKEQYVYKPGETNLQSILINGVSPYNSEHTEQYYKDNGFLVFDSWDEVATILDNSIKEKYVNGWIEITEIEFMDALEEDPDVRNPGGLSFRPGLRLIRSFHLPSPPF